MNQVPSDDLHIMTSQKFSAMIEQRISDGSSAIEAITDYCFKHDFEIESAAKLCNLALKRKIAEEAKDLRMLKPPPPPPPEDE